jgi:hypothetical protein
MKFNFKKIGSVLASAAMIGATAGFAAAANYPAPFDAGDYSIVIGSSLDMAAATTIGTNLMGDSTGDVTIGTGDSYKIEKSSTKFVLGKGILDIDSTGTITDDDLSTILADGEYLDNDNDAFKYTQKLTLANSTLDLFDDSDYKQDTPTVGIAIASGAHVLNYTLDFTTDPLWADLSNSVINMMGKEYYISSATTNTTLNLLDAANTALIGEGETKTVNVEGTDYTVALEPGYLSGSASSPQVKLSVNGELTNSLSEGNTFKLTNGVYVGIKDIAMRDVSGTAATVEFSIGTGKIEMTSSSNMKMNEVSINGLTAYFTNSQEKLQKIVVEWTADDDEFATEDSTIVMPGLENLAISYTGMEYPAEEVIVVEKGSSTYVRLSNFPLKSGAADIPLLYGNGTNYYGVGQEATKQLLTKAGTSAVIDYDDDEYDFFVASYDDGTNKESYLMRATNFATTDSVNKTTVQYSSDGVWTNAKADAINGDSVEVGDVSLTIGFIDKNDKQVNFTAGNNVYFDRLFSAEGLKVYLPLANNTFNAPVWPYVNMNQTAVSANVTTTYEIAFVEETRTGATTGGKGFNATAGWSSAKSSITGVTGESPDGGYEIGDSDVMRSFVDGDLATELLYDTSGDQDSLKIIYHGDESYGNVYISELSAVSGSGAAGNVVVLMDTEITAAQKEANLIVVGGSCVNAIAAELLGGALCAADFTSATTVGAGAYLIETYANPYASGKIATLVAGYEQADTVNAANALLAGVSTAVNAKVVGPA